MRKVFLVLSLVVGFFLAPSAQASPKESLKKHALPSAALAAGKGAVAAPHAALKLSVKAIGGVFRVAEAGADVVHAGTFALKKAGDVELKHNPFVVPNKLAGYADTGLEKAYFFLVHVQI